MPVRIVLADDQPIIRVGLAALARESGIEIVGQVNSPDQILASIEQHRPDVLLMEVRLAGHDALKTLEALPDQNLRCKIIVFSASENPTNIARASAMGCYDFLFKSTPVDQVLRSIESAAAGRETPPDSLLTTTKARLRRSGHSTMDSPLTDRETQVLRHLSMGLKNREIGRSLGISVETVKEHVQNILRKLDVNDRTQAAVWALRNQYI